MRRLLPAQYCRRDFIVFCIVFVCTVLAGVQAGLAVGVVANWALFLMRANPTSPFSSPLPVRPCVTS